ncbi:hypothetical protein FSP39_017389 [Pinctada imbricata]|uniref:chitin synthase n=1 Tax=Pinctada imbricata TaxID=66713 RepID=A0AA88Y5F7_PINIB|nr:hypothetical protein FSP39_017389 [Pinctada imbricata]
MVSISCLLTNITFFGFKINPLVELFGNAVTTLNANSSRFGKLIELFYSSDRKLMGDIHSPTKSRNYHERSAFKDADERLKYKQQFQKGEQIFRYLKYTNEFIHWFAGHSGFENFADTSKNRFEQLLINITNERLHQYFQRQIFKVEEEDYLREGLNLQNVQYLHKGNQDVLDLHIRRKLCGKSLNSLNDILTKAKPLFIRCIKPNKHLHEGVFDIPYASNQLLSTGILEVSKIRRDGFPVRLKLEHFVNRYEKLHVSDKHDITSESSMSDPPPYDSVVDEVKLPLFDIFRTTEREESGCDNSERVFLRLSRVGLYILLFCIILVCGVGCLTGLLALASELRIQVFFYENAHVAGTAILLFKVLPRVDSIWGTVFLTGSALIPSLMNFAREFVLAKRLHRKLCLRMAALISSFLSLSIQCFTYVAICYNDIFEDEKSFTLTTWDDYLYFTVSTLCVSSQWVECFIVSDNMGLPFLRWRKQIRRTREKLNIALIVSKCLVFFCLSGVLTSSFSLSLHLYDKKNFEFKYIDFIQNILPLTDYNEDTTACFRSHYNIVDPTPVPTVIQAAISENCSTDIAALLASYFLNKMSSETFNITSFPLNESVSLDNSSIDISTILVSYFLNKMSETFNITSFPVNVSVISEHSTTDIATILASSFLNTVSSKMLNMSSTQVNMSALSDIYTADIARILASYFLNKVSSQTFNVSSLPVNISVSTENYTIDVAQTLASYFLNKASSQMLNACPIPRHVSEISTTTALTSASYFLSHIKSVMLNMSSTVTCELPRYGDNGRVTLEHKSFNLFEQTCGVTNTSTVQLALASADEYLSFLRYCKYAVGSIYENYSLVTFLCIIPLVLVYSACVACRLHMQRVSFSLPLVLVPIAALGLVIGICDENAMYFEGSLTCNSGQVTADNFKTELLSLGGCLCFTLITWHTWWPSIEVMAKTEKMFVMPLLDGLFTPISLLFRRRFDKLEGLLDRRSKYHVNKKERKKTKERPIVYVCATMWHETKQEMTQLLKSLFRLDYFHSQCQLAEREFGVSVDYFNVEARGNIEWDKQPNKTSTPYGGRLSWTMPGGTNMVFHLKDKTKIRNRKRWSQVMYMYYLLGYNFTEKRSEAELNAHNHRHRRRGKSSLLNHFDHRTFEKASNTFILTLDGDTDFKPESVRLLLDKMIKNDKVGAVCGRIHPVGAGPMIWYQRFEYSVGHWLQKAAEHVFGCILCCPGCFSLFRGSALMDDNVMKMYTTPPSEAKHYIQFEQGEDRWLCTLLLQQGWKIEYCAGADAFTFSPETFKDFFVQRRRWAPSTLANIIDLVSSWSITVKTNDNISSLFMFYQFILLSSSLLGPALVTLMIAGSYTAVFRIHEWYGLLLAIAPVVVYIGICIKARNETQILVAGLLSSLYSVVMVIVTVGTLLNALSEPIYSPIVILPISLAFVFLTAGLMHPKEILNLVFGILYYLTVPSTFVFLTVYYLCNLHIVSWGTREGSSSNNQTDDHLDMKKKTQKTGVLGKWINKLGLSKIGKEIKLLLRRSMKGDVEKDTGTEDENTIKIKLEESPEVSKIIPVQVLPVPENESFPLPMPAEQEKIEGVSAWSSSGFLGDKIPKEIDIQESAFWKYIIPKYLTPMAHNEKDKEKIRVELVSLRNNVVFGFFLLNLLFTILVFQLQINKESLRNFFFLGEYEPVSLVFLFVFAVIVLIQYFGMVMHRWGTYQHLIASMNLGICGKHASDESYSQLALKEVGKLQSANSDIVRDDDNANASMTSDTTFDPNYPPEDYSTDEDTPDYDTDSPDYSDDQLETVQENAYFRNFQQRFNTRRLMFSHDQNRRTGRPLHLDVSRRSTQDLYYRTIRDRGIMNSYGRHNQNMYGVHHV